MDEGPRRTVGGGGAPVMGLSIQSPGSGVKYRTHATALSGLDVAHLPFEGRYRFFGRNRMILDWSFGTHTLRQSSPDLSGSQISR